MHIVDLHLHAPGRTLVSRLDWEIGNGECWCVIGRNGAGKSTLLRTLAGMRDPDGGIVLWKRKALAQWPLQDLAKARAWLPQSHGDAFGYRAIDTVLAARYPWHDENYWESETDIEAALRALDAFDAAHLAQRDVRTLSGGERRRVGLAAAVAQDASILLLDEPANALDLAHQASLALTLSRLRSEEDKTVVMASHDLNLVQAVATHVLLLMGDGSWEAGPIEEVMQTSQLSRCLGYPVDAIVHGDKRIFIPAFQHPV